MTDPSRRGLRTLVGALVLLPVLVLAGCGNEPKPRDAGSGDGSGYGVPQK